MPETLWLQPTAALLLGYLLGSIPFGVLVTRMAGAGDVRRIGSGNIGATNVLRTGRKDLAALTLLLDGGKGALAYFLGEQIGSGFGIHAAAGAFLGHLFPLFLRFKGGKGVATFFGLTLAMYWPIGLVFAATWLLVLGLLRYSSLAGLAAAIASPVAAAWFGKFDLTLLFLAFALLVLWKHRENIARLLSGDEPRVGAAKA